MFNCFRCIVNSVSFVLWLVISYKYSMIYCFQCIVNNICFNVCYELERHTFSS